MIPFLLAERARLNEGCMKRDGEKYLNYLGKEEKKET